jgi:hypothetical protein
METQEIFETLSTGPGRFVSVTWHSDVKTAAAHKAHAVRKTCTAVVRAGVDYANIAQNAERETGALPWGEWEHFPYIISHKGRDYVRLYRGEGSHILTAYTVDGREATAEEVREMLTPSDRDRRSDGPVLTFTVKAENVERIGA